MSAPRPNAAGVRCYAQWAGNKKGHAEDPTRCIEEVWPSTGRWLPAQCRRKRGYGPDAAYCKQHSRITEEKSRRIGAAEGGT